MANEELFSSRADEYVKGRPSYAPEAIGFIFEHLLNEGDVVADIGSGTGIMSKEFVSRGFETYCVEPNDKMRAAAEKLLGGNSNFHSVAAAAENTGLDESSVSLVTAASAFHWFDTRKFGIECRRILRPNGKVCLLANVRVYDDFTVKQHELCIRYCNEYTTLTHGFDMMNETVGDFFEAGYTREDFDFPLFYTKEKFIARSMSSSYAPELGSYSHKEYQKELMRLLDERFPGDDIRIENKTVMYVGRPKG